jgi:antitoxin MazE
MKSASLNIDQLVSVKVQKGRIVIEPLVQQEYQLKELLAGITTKNLHSEVNFGRPVGKELL